MSLHFVRFTLQYTIQSPRLPRRGRHGPPRTEPAPDREKTMPSPTTKSTPARPRSIHSSHSTFGFDPQCVLHPSSFTSVLSVSSVVNNSVHKSQSAPPRKTRKVVGGTKRIAEERRETIAKPGQTTPKNTPKTHPLPSKTLIPTTKTHFSPEQHSPPTAKSFKS